MFAMLKRSIRIWYLVFSVLAAIAFLGMLSCQGIGAATPENPVDAVALTVEYGAGVNQDAEANSGTHVPIPDSATSTALHDQGADAVPFTSEYYAGLNERFGIGFATGITVTVNGAARPALITDYDVGLLHVGWYCDWWIRYEPPRPGGIKFAQLIQVRATTYPTNTQYIPDAIAANPGALWIVGNEPEAKYGQGKRTPAEYAEIYHDMYMLIKGLDPTAWVAIGGVVEPTPLRLRWLEMTLDEYQTRYGQAMPVDVWNIHVQILQEVGGTPEDPDPPGAEIPVGLSDTQGELYRWEDNANPAIFQQLVTDFRQWMKDQGFQDKPLIISEYGVLYPSWLLTAPGAEAQGDQMVIDFMRQTFDFLVTARDTDLGYPADDRRLVQQWLWYSLNDEPFNDATGKGYNGGLFDDRDPARITKFGAAFRDYIHVLMGYPRVMLPGVIKRASLGGQLP
jgi:hypothetical protein